MAIVDLVMPKMGESIIEATILKWHKQPGDSVKQDETVLDIATDKVDSEVPSVAAGIIEELLFKVNDVVPVGAVIARIRTESSVPETKPDPKQEPPVPQSAEEVVKSPDTIFQPVASNGNLLANGNGNGGKFYSPLVLNIASNEGISLSELEKIPGTGNEGRVTKKDILLYVSERKKPAETAGIQAEKIPNAEVKGMAAEELEGSSSGKSALKEPVYTGSVVGGNVEILEMDRMRRLIADHMVKSKQTSPHVTSFTEADLTNIVTWREKVKKDFEKREGTKLTFTPIFIEAIVRCIKRFPLINCSLDGDKIIIKKDINLGMATALPSGNLIVPVIRNSDQYNLVGLAKQVNTLADNARNNKLKPEDTQGGTFTMTNVGVFGSLMGTPIINQPQVAIIALGAIKKRAVVIETEQGDSIGIRHMMYLSLSYDHRIVDGSIGASFLTAVAKELESFNGERAY